MAASLQTVIEGATDAAAAALGKAKSSSPNSAAALREAGHALRNQATGMARVVADLKEASGLQKSLTPASPILNALQGAQGQGQGQGQGWP